MEKEAACNLVLKAISGFHSLTSLFPQKVGSSKFEVAGFLGQLPALNENPDLQLLSV